MSSTDVYYLIIAICSFLIVVVDIRSYDWTTDPPEEDKTVYSTEVDTDATHSMELVGNIVTLTLEDGSSHAVDLGAIEEEEEEEKESLDLLFHVLLNMTD